MKKIINPKKQLIRDLYKKGKGLTVIQIAKHKGVKLSPSGVRWHLAN